MKNFIIIPVMLGSFLYFVSFPEYVFAAKKTVETESPKSSISETEIGISAGLWFSGTASVWTDDWEESVDKSNSLMFRAILDKNIGRDFAVGMYGNFSQFKAEDADVDGTMMEFGFAFKPRFYINPTFAVKPGLNIGYRQISSSDIDTIDALGLNFSCEFQFLNDEGPSFYMDFGFLAQPTGGNEDWHFTFGPIFYLLAGVLF